MHNCPTIPHDNCYEPDATPEQAAQDFYDVMRKRRSVRMFSDKPVSREAIESIIKTAHSAPSGANKQPWAFVCVQDPSIKKQIREGAEAEEKEFYNGRANAQWLKDLAPYGTDENKAFLETVPWLIVVFRLTKGDDGGQVYYSSESVGLACGMLLSAAQHAGLATLTHTPSPMNFLNTILDRPANERPYLLIPVGYPADDCVVPAAAVERKPIEQVLAVC